MRGVILHGPGDVRVEEREDPTILEPTDAIIRITAACVCGSDLWPFRGFDPVKEPIQIGHEYVGVVEEVGSAVTRIKVGDFVVGPFVTADNTCEICKAGYHTHCPNHVDMPTIGMQAERARIPQADGSLVATPGQPDEDLIPSLLTASDVLATGWYGAVCADVGPGKTVVVIGDGAVGLMAVLAAKQLGAERIIAMSRHADRQALARTFGATDIVEERGDEGVAKIKEITGGWGADSVIEAVGTKESMSQAIRSTRPGGHLGYVGVPVTVELNAFELFGSSISFTGGVAPVIRFLPDLVERIWNRSINPGLVFDLTLPLEDAAEAYKAMDERRATKVLLRP
ncbi:zinc-dependent alcohol dehydrogenase family protein [Rathayibacter sp. VKM Ac-2835]|uniref:zinc-dependent alcohol dehydrogenase family protein n=1 Tax=Rathayibacter sp. VKM Ac-2835 TaxID=2739043 RepID=UPI001563BD7D|nr:zinc-dependent alcohol dehydrogenase family protein [Rathayibacter sp. VKM Ac-2835]NRG42634.1 zinc-dependent alcohol dehydrogenase family protein [Rathayibacter sp. VKM Ac-2835]